MIEAMALGLVVAILSGSVIGIGLCALEQKHPEATELRALLGIEGVTHKK